MNEMITIKDISKILGMDKSNARKYILSKGFSFNKIRTRETNGQLTLALPSEDVQSILEIRRSEGFIIDDITYTIDNVSGKFYLVQIVPDLDKSRVKLGYSSNVESRLRSYKTTCPNARIIKTWNCKFSWEKAVIDSVTKKECRQIGQEVFSCDNLANLTERIDGFFDLMPSL